MLIIFLVFLKKITVHENYLLCISKEEDNVQYMIIIFHVSLKNKITVHENYLLCILEDEDNSAE